MLPQIKYPLVTILEIENTENTRYTDLRGEHISDLGYQIECYSRNTTELEATESAMLMGNQINKLLTSEKYRLARVGTPQILPVTTDEDVMRYILRYNCSVDIDTNTIYSRS